MFLNLRQLHSILNLDHLNWLLRIIVLAYLADIECFDLLGVLWCHERPCLGSMNIIITSHWSTIASYGYETVGLGSYFLHSAVFESTSNLFEWRLAIAWSTLECITGIAIIILRHFYDLFLLYVQIHSVFYSGW
jgi:hypothetical protein